MIDTLEKFLSRLVFLSGTIFFLENLNKIEKITLSNIFILFGMTVAWMSISKDNKK
ncbi:hypothetical protein [Enterococcus termitis]|nr:hypothetical protein RV18_GL000677 [Enterococcus termitis]